MREDHTEAACRMYTGGLAIESTWFFSQRHLTQPSSDF